MFTFRLHFFIVISCHKLSLSFRILSEFFRNFLRCDAGPCWWSRWLECRAAAKARWWTTSSVVPSPPTWAVAPRRAENELKTSWKRAVVDDWLIWAYPMLIRVYPVNLFDMFRSGREGAWRIFWKVVAAPQCPPILEKERICARQPFAEMFWWFQGQPIKESI